MKMLPSTKEYLPILLRGYILRLIPDVCVIIREIQKELNIFLSLIPSVRSISLFKIALYSRPPF